ncbi:MAG: hypothetical protein JXA60_07425 [Candidatus Coatesbacteria bacterium]|nr:hypothetical protein [Candidatus Coatesbacteria bacterium]
MKNLILSIIITILFLDILHARKSPFEFSLSWEPWNPGLNSKIAIADTSFEQKSFSLNDVGIDSKWLTQCVSVSFGISGIHYFNYTNLPFSYSGEKVLNKQIYFKELSFNPNDSVLSAIDLSVKQFSYTGYFIKKKHFKIGMGISAQIANLNASMESRITGYRQNYERQLIAPVPYLNLGINTKYVQFEGKIGTISTLWLSKLSRYEDYFDKSDTVKEILEKKGKIFHSEVIIQTRPLSYMALGLGYRNYNAVWQLDDSHGDIRFEGIFMRTSFYAPFK